MSHLLTDRDRPAHLTPEQWDDCRNVGAAIMRRFLRRLPREIDAEQVEAAGHLALWQACHTFDAARGAKLTTHVGAKVKWALQEEARLNSPYSRREGAIIREAAAAWLPVPPELREPLPFDQLIPTANRRRSDLRDEDGLTLDETLCAPDDPAAMALDSAEAALLWRVVADLPHPKGAILLLHYAADLSLKGMSLASGHSHAWASKHQIYALRLLRERLTAIGWLPAVTEPPEPPAVTPEPVPARPAPPVPAETTRLPHAEWLAWLQETRAARLTLETHTLETQP